MSITEHSMVLYDQITGDPSILACKGADPDTFFPENRKELWKAQSLCSACPMKAKCLELGKAEKQTGVWGGQYLKNGQVKLRPFNGQYRQSEEFEQSMLQKSA